jgi:hypothetical protein
MTISFSFRLRLKWPIERFGPRDGRAKATSFGEYN